MTTPRFYRPMLLLWTLWLAIPPLTAQQVPIVVGRMSEVMWQGQLQGKISLDTLADKAHLYGLGPLAYLAGEILVLDGRAYRSVVTSPTDMQVTATWDLEAPFFGYARIADWQEQELPKDVNSLIQLENYLDQWAKNRSEPFFFKIKAWVDEATIHVVNLPKGSTVSSPDEAHRGLTKYPIRAAAVDILGFYSRHHKAILTHHDTNMHLHLITADRLKMGHLDALQLRAGTARVYLPGGKN